MSKKSAPVVTRPTRKQLSRREREQRQTRLLFIGTGTVLALVVLILGWGLTDQYVLRPRKPVATVGGVPISLGTYQKQVQYFRWDHQNYINRLESQKLQLGTDDTSGFFMQYLDQQIMQLQSELMNLPSTVLDDLIEDQIIRQESAQRALVLAPDEVDARLEEQFGYERNPPTPTATPITATLPLTVTPTATATPMTYEQYESLSQQWFQAMRENTGFTEADFRRLIEGSLYREELLQAIGDGVSTTADQLHASHILVETPEEAEEVLRRLGDGEAFEDLAMEMSTDTGSADVGGDLGWFPRGQMLPEFEEAALSLQPGEISGAVESQYGYHIIRLEERDTERELSEADLEQARQRAFDDWLTERKFAEDVVRSWDSTMIPTRIPTRVPQRS